MKQLIEISPLYLKRGDLVFDYKHRDLQKVEYVSIEDENGRSEHSGTMGVPHVVHVDYGEEAMSADNLSPDSKVLILIDTEKLEILEPANIGYR